LDMEASSFSLVVTAHTEFDTSISDCAHCMQRVFTYLIPNAFQQHTVDVVKGVDVNPNSGILLCLGAMWGKTIVNACHIKACFCLVTFTFLCVHILVKNFSHLNMVLLGYPDQRRPILKCMKILLSFNPSLLTTVHCTVF
jgi:hypothetical protein